MAVITSAEETTGTKTFELYFNDLTEEAQKQLIDFLGGDNGNYDVFPIATLEVQLRDSTTTW